MGVTGYRCRTWAQRRATSAPEAPSGHLPQSGDVKLSLPACPCRATGSARERELRPARETTRLGVGQGEKEITLFSDNRILSFA